MTPVTLRHSLLRANVGVAGLIRAAGGFLAVVQSLPAQIVVLDASLSVVDVIEAPHAVNAHSILEWEDMWFVAATGADAVVAVDPLYGRSAVVWRHPSGDADAYHINSLFVHGGKLCATAMGVRCRRWADFRHGLAWELLTGDVLLAPLYQPHSARSIDGSVVACESMMGRVVSTGLGVLDVPIGYVRGFDMGHDDAAIATSRRRHPPVGRCTVQYFERAGGRLEDLRHTSRVDLSHVAREVYDVVLLDDDELQ